MKTLQNYSLVLLFLFAVSSVVGIVHSTKREALPILKPQRLADTCTVQLVSPAGSYRTSMTQATQRLTTSGNLKTVTPNINLSYGANSDQYPSGSYLAGTDAQRASDINNGFASSSVNWLLANRGGYGCDRVLDLLDFTTIQNNPKPVMGYSDLTALINVIHAQTGLITFYGPMGIDASPYWNGSKVGTNDNYSALYARQVLFNASLVTFSNPSTYVPTNPSALRTITAGTTQGKLLGGNLSVFVTIAQSTYLQSIDWTNVILFLEETGEQSYAVDRYLSTLKNAGILNQIKGFIWGTCYGCTFTSPMDMNAILDYYIKPLGIPSYAGAMFGHHQTAQFTLPIGLQVELDATARTIRMLESAVL